MASIVDWVNQAEEKYGSINDAPEDCYEFLEVRKELKYITKKSNKPVSREKNSSVY